MSQSSTSSQASQRPFPSAFPTTQETFCVPPCFLNSQHLPRPYLLSFCCVPRLYQPTPLLLLFCRAVPSCRRRFRGAVLQTHHSHAIYLSVALSLSLSQFEYTKLEGISIHRRDPNFNKACNAENAPPSSLCPSRRGTLFTHILQLCFTEHVRDHSTNC